MNKVLFITQPLIILTKRSPWGTQFWLWYHFKSVHEWNKPFNCRKCALTLSHMGYFPTHSTWQGVVITPSKDILTLISEHLFLWSLCGQVVTALDYIWTGFFRSWFESGRNRRFFIIQPIVFCTNSFSTCSQLSFEV